MTEADTSMNTALASEPTFKRIDYASTKPFLLHKHYAHRMPSISYAFGLYINGVIHGVLTYGTPASPALVRGVAGAQNATHVIELNRLYVDDEVSEPNLTSRFVAWTLRYLKGENKIVVSYADSGMNHVGYIYQACNFYYTGKTVQRTDKYAGKNHHARHYEHGESKTYRIVRTSKYRYIYLACDRRHKKQYLADLRYPIYDSYPKGDGRPMEHYLPGETKSETLKVIATGELIKEDDIV